MTDCSSWLTSQEDRLVALTPVIMTTANVILKSERIRLMIQIIVILEILISCIPRSEVIWLAYWAKQPSRTPGNRSPSGWRTEGIVRLVEGMPNDSPTWSERWTDSAKSRTQRRLLRSGGRDAPGDGQILERLDQSPRPRKNGDAGSLMTRRPGLLPAHHWLATDRCAAEARKTKVAGWGALNGLPNCLDPAYLQKRLSVSPRG